MSGRRGKRTRIAPGIFRDAYGISVVARIGSTKKGTARSSPELRFDLGTDEDVLKLAQARERVKLREAAQRGAPIARGTLAADVVAYFVKAVLSKQRREERTQQLAWWVERFGGRVRASLKWQELHDALATLRDELAASTINHYRTALSNVFTVLDGKNAPNPFRDVPMEQPPDAERRDQPYEFIQVILDKLRDRGRGKALSKTKARLRVLAYAPLTPAQLWALWPADVHWAESEVSTPGRKKGAGTRAQRKPLTAEALEAFRAYDAAGCWGKKPSRSSMRRIFGVARDAAIKELRKTRPDLDLSRAATMRPYDLRHSFGTVALASTGSLPIVQQLLDHADARTTLRYAQGAVPALLKVAGDSIAQAFAAVPPYQRPEATGFPAGLPRSTSAEIGSSRILLMKTRGVKSGGSGEAAAPKRRKPRK